MESFSFRYSLKRNGKNATLKAEGNLREGIDVYLGNSKLGIIVGSETGGYRVVLTMGGRQFVYKGDDVSYFLEYFAKHHEALTKGKEYRKLADRIRYLVRDGVPRSKYDWHFFDLPRVQDELDGEQIIRDATSTELIDIYSNKMKMMDAVVQAFEEKFGRRPPHA